MPKQSIKKMLAEWQKKFRSPSLNAMPERRSVFETSSQIPLDDLYAPKTERLSEDEYLSQVGFPGQYPFTRGVQPTMYRARLWTMRQYAGFGTAEEANERYKYLLSQGTTGLSVAFDLPTQMGRDSDDALAAGEVGRVGVAIDTRQDMERLFEGIPLDTVSTSMTINATAHILLALYLVIAEKHNIPFEKLRGTIQNDILKEYIARGTYIYPPKPSLKIVADIFEYCRDVVPKWNTISVSGYHIREAGSTAVQEVAFTLANGITYVSEAINRGLDVDSFAPRVAFFFNCHNNFLEEVAKFRAARRMWARIMREHFNAKDDKSCMLRFHTQTAGSTLTAQQPSTNIVRTTLQALSAVMGGTQSLHTNAFDEALCLPTEESALLALRTQQIIACESGVPDVVDPFAGSYAVEELTDQIEIRAWEYIEKLESLGGVVAAIEAGFPQREIEEAAFRYQRALEEGSEQVVGVNAHTEKTGERPADLQNIDPAGEKRQIERLQQFRASRNHALVDTSLVALERAASANENIMPMVVEAVRNGASLGEISNVLRKLYGEYQPN